jgi:dihydrofolate reductase
MTTFLFSAAMSLDGFIAGPGGDMSWLSDLLAEPEAPDSGDLTAEIGALLIGKRTFTGDDPNAGTDAEGAYGGTWDGPSIVLTHTPPPDDAAPEPGTTYATDLDSAIRLAREAAGDKAVSILGANVAAQCLAAGVLDEILVFVTPVLLGDGVRLFDHPGGTQVRLERIPERSSPTALRYRVVH